MADLSTTLMLDLESNNLSATNTDIFREARSEGAGSENEASVMQRDRKTMDRVPFKKQANFMNFHTVCILYHPDVHKC